MTTHFDNVRIAGIVSGVPCQSEDAVDLQAFLSKEQAAKISKSTGITERRIAPSHQTVLDLSIPLAEKLLEDLDWSKDSIGAIIFVTQTPDYLLPNNSVQLQNSLGTPKSTLTLDINQGCSGFMQGLFVGHSLSKSGVGPNILLVCGDIASAYIDPSDTNTRPLFGDGISVIGIQSADKAYTSQSSFDMGSDGAGANYLIVKNGGLKDRYTSSPELFMDGTQVFAFTLREVPSSINRVLGDSGNTVADIDTVVMHQANKMMINHLGQKLDIPQNKLLIALSNTGNTGSASIPMALSLTYGELGHVPDGKYLFCGFGVGWTWGTCVIDIKDLPTDLPWIVSADHKLEGQVRP